MTEGSDASHSVCEKSREQKGAKPYRLQLSYRIGRRNITFFDPAPEMKRVESCARLAAIHDDVVAMPMGYQTLVGDMGTVLSGGQKQRVLLARALYKQPKILILDEATSHLDVAREREVSEAVQSLKLTRVIVAHRRETIASADRVFALGPAPDLKNTTGDVRRFGGH